MAHVQVRSAYARDGMGFVRVLKRRKKLRGELALRGMAWRSMQLPSRLAVLSACRSRAPLRHVRYIAA